MMTQAPELFMTLFLHIGQPAALVAAGQQVAAIPRVGDVIWTNDDPKRTHFWTVKRIEWGFKKNHLDKGQNRTFAYVYVEPVL